MSKSPRKSDTSISRGNSKESSLSVSDIQQKRKNYYRRLSSKSNLPKKSNLESNSQSLAIIESKVIFSINTNMFETLEEYTKGYDLLKNRIFYDAYTYLRIAAHSGNPCAVVLCYWIILKCSIVKNHKYKKQILQIYAIRATKTGKHLTNACNNLLNVSDFNEEPIFYSHDEIFFCEGIAAQYGLGRAKSKSLSEYLLNKSTIIKNILADNLGDTNRETSLL